MITIVATFVFRFLSVAGVPEGSFSLMGSTKKVR